MPIAEISGHEPLSTNGKADPLVVMDCNIEKVYYGSFKDSLPEERDHGLHRAVGVREKYSTPLSEPDE